MLMRTRLAPIAARARHLVRERQGNVLMLFAFSLIPMTFATGMGIDYARAMRLQTKLNAIADASALAAVSKVTMSTDTNTAKWAAYQMFVAQATPLLQQGLTMNFLTDVTITIPPDSQSGTGVVRKVTVTYTGKSANSFAKILGMNVLNIGGTSASTASTAPNIDFYIMMDTSPSMLLPATTAGLQAMLDNTPKTGNDPNGCTFACHTTDSNSSENYYAIARSNKIVLRTDLVTTAVQDLTGTATKMMQNNNAVYRMGLLNFDYMYRNIWPTSKNADNSWVDSDLTRVNNHVVDSTVLTYCANNYRVCDTKDNDTGTNYTAAMNGAYQTIPTPGNGTNASSDKPQAVLFIITDGMTDEAQGSNRKIGPINTSLCDTIKNNGVRIAILNTRYLPESVSYETWSINTVKTPYLAPTDKITPALQTCASSGLYYQVTTDDDVSAALSALFQQAVATAHLTK